MKKPIPSNILAMCLVKKLSLESQRITKKHNLTEPEKRQAMRLRRSWLSLFK